MTHAHPPRLRSWMGGTGWEGLSRPQLSQGRHSWAHMLQLVASQAQWPPIPRGGAVLRGGGGADTFGYQHDCCIHSRDANNNTQLEVMLLCARRRMSLFLLMFARGFSLLRYESGDLGSTGSERISITTCLSSHGMVRTCQNNM